MSNLRLNLARVTRVLVVGLHGRLVTVRSTRKQRTSVVINEPATITTPEHHGVLCIVGMKPDVDLEELARQVPTHAGVYHYACGEEGHRGFHRHCRSAGVGWNGTSITIVIPG